MRKVQCPLGNLNFVKSPEMAEIVQMSCYVTGMGKIKGPLTTNECPAPPPAQSLFVVPVQYLLSDSVCPPERVVQEPSLRGIPLLVLANKQDLEVQIFVSYPKQYSPI